MLKPQPIQLPLTWHGKNLDDLTVDELKIAQKILDDMFTSDSNIRSSPEFAKKFKNRPLPTINPSFVKLREAIAAELTKRNS
jgi:hypothetical protein